MTTEKQAATLTHAQTGLLLEAATDSYLRGLQNPEQRHQGQRISDGERPIAGPDSPVGAFPVSASPARILHSPPDSLTGRMNPQPA